MSLTIGITNPQGIVLAADSRQTYVNNLNQNRVGSDTATKIIPLTPSTAVSIAGSVYIDKPTQQQPYPKSVPEYITEFGYSLKGDETVAQIATKLHNFILKKYKVDEKIAETKKQLQEQVKQQGASIISNSMVVRDDGAAVTAQVKTADGQLVTAVAPLNNIAMTVAGYDELGSKQPKQNLFLLNVPGNLDHRRKHNQDGQYGAVWQGQHDVVNRIVKGFDPRVGNLPFVNVQPPQAQDQMRQQLDQLEYNIAWQSMTLHDAIDLSKLLVETSIAVQKFSSGPMIAPTDIQGIGGQVDVAIIDPIEGFGWVNFKKLPITRPEFRKSLDIEPIKGI